MEKRELVKQFNELAEWESHPFKKRAYSKAAEIIAAMSDEEFLRQDDHTDFTQLKKRLFCDIK